MPNAKSAPEEQEQLQEEQQEQKWTIYNMKQKKQEQELLEAQEQQQEQNQKYCVGTLSTKHTSSGDSGTNRDLMPLTPDQKPERKKKWRMDHRDQDLLEPGLSWEQKVVKVLHMIRCQEFTEYNPKMYRSVPTRFCAINIAFFDLDKNGG